MGFFPQISQFLLLPAIRLQGLCKENKLLMKYLVTYSFLTDIKNPVSLGLATFVSNIPLPKGKPLLKDKRKIALVACLDEEAGLLLVYIYWKSF